jgi:hypothetical protein
MSTRSELMDFDGPKDEDLIVAAEQALGLTFPHDYRRFLAEFGAGSFGGTEIYGVIDADFVNSSVPDAIWNTLTLREDGLPPNVVAFHATGDGEELCLVCDSPAGGPVIVFVPGAMRRVILKLLPTTSAAGFCRPSSSRSRALLAEPLASRTER